MSSSACVPFHGCGSTPGIPLRPALSTDVPSSDDIAKVVLPRESFQAQRKESRSKDTRDGVDLSFCVPLEGICTQHINQAQGLSSEYKDFSAICFSFSMLNYDTWSLGFSVTCPINPVSIFFWVLHLEKLRKYLEGPYPALALNLKEGLRHFRLLTGYYVIFVIFVIALYACLEALQMIDLKA